MKVLRAIFAFFRYAIMLFLIATIAIILVQRVSDNRSAVAGLRLFTVVTESMVPEYLVGDTILVKEVPPEELEVGDNVSYLGEKESFKDKIITHKIVDKKTDENGRFVFTTKGVAADKEDPQIDEKQIYGKVIYKVKSISFINSIIGNLYGMYFFIIVPMALMMFYEYWSYKKDKFTEDDEDSSEHEKKKKKRISKRRERRRKAKTQREISKDIEESDDEDDDE